MNLTLLPQIQSPTDLRALTIDELPQLAAEIRHAIGEQVMRSGGHFAPNLGVVELTIALHCVFNTPDDTLIWDVGHQTYPHKILTSRRELMQT